MGNIKVNCFELSTDMIVGLNKDKTLETLFNLETEQKDHIAFRKRQAIMRVWNLLEEEIVSAKEHIARVTVDDISRQAD